MEFVADFETTYNRKTNTARVWLFGIQELTDRNARVGTSIEQFFAEIKRIYSYNITIYFHNLKFDGSYILNYLLSHGFQNVTGDGYNKNDQPENTVQHFIDKGGRWYNIEVQIGKQHITFVDSLKMMIFSIAQIAKTLHLPVSKGEIDYTKYRKPSYKPTADEVTYLKTDLEILRQGVNWFRGSGFKKNTIAGSVFSIIKKDFIKPEQFKEWFPLLPEPQHEFAQAAYRGGYSYVNPVNQNRELKGIRVFDSNSAYPWAMSSQYFPVGEPAIYYGDIPEYAKNTNDFVYIVRLKATGVTKEKRLPTIQIKDDSRYNAREYVTSFSNATITLTSVDFELMKEQYLLDYQIEEVHVYKAEFAPMGEFVKHYMALKVEAKKQHDAGRTLEAKVALNSSYGKFGTKTDADYKVAHIEDGILKFTTVADTKDPVYMPFAAFVTAYVRRNTITTAQREGDRFVYSDTDSVHILGDGPTIKKDPYKLGYWKDETAKFSPEELAGYEEEPTEVVSSRYIRAKTYMDVFNNGMKNITVAGLTDRQKKNIDPSKFGVGMVVGGKLVPRQVKGGVQLFETTFEIKE